MWYAQNLQGGCIFGFVQKKTSLLSISLAHTHLSRKDTYCYVNIQFPLCVCGFVAFYYRNLSTISLSCSTNCSKKIDMHHMFYSSFKKSCPLQVTSFTESTLCLQSGSDIISTFPLISICFLSLLIFQNGIKVQYLYDTFSPQSPSQTTELPCVGQHFPSGDTYLFIYLGANQKQHSNVRWCKRNERSMQL